MQNCISVQFGKQQTIILPYRVYTDEARHELDLLSNTWLVDEFEQSLRNMGDYRKAIDHVIEVCPSLQEYMEKNLLFLTGDWPTWYYNKKIICQVCIKLIIFNFNFTTAQRKISMYTTFLQSIRQDLQQFDFKLVVKHSFNLQGKYVSALS